MLKVEINIEEMMSHFTEEEVLAEVSKTIKTAIAKVNADKLGRVLNASKKVWNLEYTQEDLDILQKHLTDKCLDEKKKEQEKISNSKPVCNFDKDARKPTAPKAKPVSTPGVAKDYTIPFPPTMPMTENFILDSLEFLDILKAIGALDEANK